MAGAVGLSWLLLAKDDASPAFLRVAASADKAATATQRATARVATAGAKMSSVGAMMSRRLTLPLLAIGAASVKAATDFNASMTRIQTQAGASAKDVKTLTAQVLAMKGAQQGPNALAGALYHLKSVGLDNAGAMKALRASSDLAAVGNANLEETTNALAGAWRSGIKGAGSFAHTAATVNAIIGAGNMTLADFTEGLSTGILPAARTFGVSLQSIGAALSVFTDEGVPANVALTRMRMTLSLLGAPTDKATKLLDGIGISSTQLAKDMRTGPNGILNAVTDLKDHLSGLSKVAQAQFLSRAFGGGRSSSAIMTMLNQVGLLGRKWDQVTGSIGKYGDAVKTQAATPQAQFKVALANLEKAGVLLGNQLLPIVIQFAHALTGLATGFNGLSSGTKHFVAEVGIGLLVLGPMLSIVGKLTKAIAFMWTVGRGALAFAAGMRGVALAEGAVASKAYLVGASFGTMGKAAGAAGLAVAAVGFSIGRMTREASGGAKALGVLASVGAGAALGASFGPPGIAIGALVGGLSNLVGGMGGAGDAAVALNTDISGLTHAFLQDGLAVGKLTNSYIAHELAQSGVLDSAGDLGLSYKTLTLAARNNKGALTQVAVAMDGNTNGAIAAGEKIFAMAEAFDQGTAKAKKISGAFHVFGMSTASLSAGSKRTGDAISRMAAGSHLATGAAHALTGAQQGEKGATDALGVSVKTLTNKLLAYASASLGMAQSEDGFQESVRGVTQQLKGSHDQLNITTKAGLANRDAFLNAATSALSLRDSQRKAGVSIGAANSKLLDNIKQLRATAIAGGATAGSVDRLLGRYHLLPRQIKTLITAETSQAEAKLFDLTGKINGLVNGYHQVTMTVVEHDGTAHGNAGAVTPARGGFITGPGTSTSDSIPARLSNGEFVVNAAQTRKHRSLLHSINRGAQGFAGGGEAGNPITTKQSGGKTVWIYKGIQYASLMAAKNAETRDQSKAKNTGTATTSAIGRIGGTPTNPIDLSTLGIARVWAQIRDARKALASDVADGLGSKAAAKFRHQIRHMVHLANAEFGKLRVKIGGSDVRALTKALHGGASDTRTAFGQLFADLRHADAPGGVLSALRKTEGAMIANQQALASANARLGTMTAYRSQIRGTLAGAFDPTTFGSVQDLGVGLRGATGTNNRYARELSKLRGESRRGSPLRRFINQLAASGQTASLETLAGASRSQLRNIAKDVGAYDRSLGAGSNAAATTKFSESVKQQHGDVDRLVKSQHDMNTSIGELARIVAHIASTGPTKAQDKRLEQIVRDLERHTKAAQRSGT